MTRRVWLAFLVIATLAACDGGPSVPPAGDLTVRLRTSRTDDGGVLFSVRAAGSNTINDVRPGCAGCQVFWQAQGANEVRVAVTGDLVDGPIAVITVSSRVPEGYTATVLEVATRSFQIVAPFGYAIEITE